MASERAAHAFTDLKKLHREMGHHLYAIAADGGWRKRLVERIGEEPLRAIARNALFHARVASALCVYLAAKPLVDPYLPDAFAGLLAWKR